MVKAFRFGIVAAQAGGAAEWKDLARRIEALGYSSLLLPDTTGPILSPFSALATAAAVTERLKVGNWVLAADFRNPVLLAREAATLALLSDGRLELGFGAGRGDNDYAALGLSAAVSGGERLSRLDEVLQVIQALSTGSPVTFEGKHYHVRNATLYPTPPDHRIPLLLAAGGPRAIALAGKRADTVALPSRSPEAFREQLDHLKTAAGERFEHIELASIVWLLPDDNPAARQASERAIRQLSGAEPEALVAARAPSVLVGTTADMVEQLQERREQFGLSYIVVSGQAAEYFAPVVQRLSGS